MTTRTQLQSNCFKSTELTGGYLDGWWNPIDIYWIPETGTFMAFREPLRVWGCRRYGEGQTPIDAYLDLQLQYDRQRSE